MTHIFSTTAPRMLYIHWPFCAAKCHYCDFVAMQDHHDFSLQYHKALCNEIRAFVRARPQVHKTPIDTIFFGGGTPSLYPLALLEELFALLRELFDLSAVQEISLEVNPGGQTREHFQVWRALGINRLSVGVQVLDDAVLARLNRPQKTEEVMDFFATAPEFITNLSVDTIIGLPGVTRAGWEKTVETCLRWPVSHMSLYFLTIHENTPLYHGVKAGTITIPRDEQVLAQYEWTTQRYAEAGFVQYEISNFARPGFESKHNQGYWNRVPYYGFGIGAASFDGAARCINKKKLSGYISYFQSSDVIGDGWHGVCERLTHQQAVLEELMLGLRQQSGVGLHRMVYLCSMSQKKSFTMVCDQLVSDGYLVVEDAVMRLTRKGQIFENEVIVMLMGGLEGDHLQCEQHKDSTE
jgi:oxygen-independent coproporphyrinogen-3 oxidase